jgi:hypothetical protein
MKLVFNNKIMRCENINCWFSHLEGRCEYMKKREKMLSNNEINFDLFI